MMETERLIMLLQEAADRSLRNEERIQKLEASHEVLHQLATSVAVMAEQLHTMSESVDSLSGKVGELERLPARRWNGIVDKAAWAAAAAFLTFLLARLGL